MFILASLYGVTLNVISLFGMIIVIGILVDDGIIIGENIYQRFEKGEDRISAAIYSMYLSIPSISGAAFLIIFQITKNISSFSWFEIFFAFILTFTEVQLLPVKVVALNSSITPWWSLSASALISVAPLIIVAFVVERYLSKGNLSGALK